MVLIAPSDLPPREAERGNFELRLSATNIRKCQSIHWHSKFWADHDCCFIDAPSIKVEGVICEVVGNVQLGQYLQLTATSRPT